MAKVLSVFLLCVFLYPNGAAAQASDSIIVERRQARPSLGKLNIDAGLSVNNQTPISLCVRMYWQSMRNFREEIQLGTRYPLYGWDAHQTAMIAYKFDTSSDNGLFVSAVLSGYYRVGSTTMLGVGYEYVVGSNSLVRLHTAFGISVFQQAVKPAFRIEVARVWKVFGNDFH